MAQRLKDKVAIITGGTSGIGEASVSLFAREGAKVVLVGRNSKRGQKIEETVKNEGGTALFIKTDVSNSQEVQTMVKETLNQFQTVDALINNAGIGQQTPVHLMDEKEWDNILAINLKSMFLCSKYVLPHMQKQKSGCIINMSSILGFVGFPGAGAYNATKGGSRLLTKNMALDYAQDNIRVNSICPGFIDTPMLEGALNPEAKKALIARHPIGRLGRPEEVAYTALFLASDESPFITGSDILVDGGYTAN